MSPTHEAGTQLSQDRTATSAALGCIPDSCGTMRASEGMPMGAWTGTVRECDHHLPRFQEKNTGNQEKGIGLWGPRGMTRGGIPTKFAGVGKTDLGAALPAAPPARRRGQWWTRGCRRCRRGQAQGLPRPHRHVSTIVCWSPDGRCELRFPSRCPLLRRGRWGQGLTLELWGSHLAAQARSKDCNTITEWPLTWRSKIKEGSVQECCPMNFDLVPLM